MCTADQGKKGEGMGQRDDAGGQLSRMPQSFNAIFSLGHQISHGGALQRR